QRAAIELIDHGERGRELRRAVQHPGVIERRVDAAAALIAAAVAPKAPESAGRPAQCARTTGTARTAGDRRAGRRPPLLRAIAGYDDRLPTLALRGRCIATLRLLPGSLRCCLVLRTLGCAILPLPLPLTEARRDFGRDAAAGNAFLYAAAAHFLE